MLQLVVVCMLTEPALKDKISKFNWRGVQVHGDILGLRVSQSAFKTTCSLSDNVIEAIRKLHLMK